MSIDARLVNVGAHRPLRGIGGFFLCFSTHPCHHCAQPIFLYYPSQTMALATRALLISRLFPIIILLLTTFVIPWCKRTYVIFGLSGANFQQTDVSNCDIIYPDKLIGCEDLHVYQGEKGPMIFTGCVEKLEHQLVCLRGETVD